MTDGRVLARKSPQAQIDLSAHELSVRALDRVESHELICAERYKSIDAHQTDIKATITEMKTDAKDRFDRLETRFTDLAHKIATGQGRADGERGVVGFIMKNLPLLLMAATLALTIAWHKQP